MYSLSHQLINNRQPCFHSCNEMGIKHVTVEFMAFDFPLFMHLWFSPNITFEKTRCPFEYNVNTWIINLGCKVRWQYQQPSKAFFSFCYPPCKSDTYLHVNFLFKWGGTTCVIIPTPLSRDYSSADIHSSVLLFDLAVVMVTWVFDRYWGWTG